MSLVIVGIGNPVLTDDAVGIKIARELEKVQFKSGEIIVKEAYAGGLRLMDALVGFDQAIIIDSIITGKNKAGTIHRSNLNDLIITRNLSSSHDLDLISALELARISGLKCPQEILIWAIEAEDVCTFSEQLTPCVQKAVSQVISEILQITGNLAGIAENLELVSNKRGQKS